MMDFWLQHQDLQIINGDITLCPNDKDTIAQAITIRLKTLAGEWFLDTNLGIPYLTDIFGHKHRERLVQQLIASEIQTTPGVVELKNFKTETTKDRIMLVSFIASLSDGAVLSINDSIGF